ncbi:unnamed protein product, partial [Rotaria sp. Silwood2]
MYNVDLPKRSPLPAATLAITAMNSSVPSRFLPNDTISVMLSNLLIEEWQFNIDFDDYYAACAPASCTYTISGRLDIISIVTTNVGLFGGLSLSLRIIIPFVAQLIYWIFITCRERQVVENRVLSRAAFELQTTGIIADFIERAPNYFRRILFFIIELLRNTLSPTAFNTDWLLEFTDWSRVYLLQSVPRMFSNGTCNCVTSTTCQEPMQIGPPDLVFPGLVVGCWPIDGLGMSTLECFYSSSCIELIINFLNYYTQIDGSPPVDFVLPTVPTLIVTPLNSSIPSRFPPNITIGKIIDELFIEQWSNKSIYENYFAACAPS